MVEAMAWWSYLADPLLIASTLVSIDVNAHDASLTNMIHVPRSTVASNDAMGKYPGVWALLHCGDHGYDHWYLLSLPLLVDRLISHSRCLIDRLESHSIASVDVRHIDTLFDDCHYNRGRYTPSTIDIDWIELIELIELIRVPTTTQELVGEHKTPSVSLFGLVYGSYVLIPLVMLWRFAEPYPFGGYFRIATTAASTRKRN